MLVKEIEDATASVALSSFSKFSKEEIKELAIRINGEHYCLVCELFKPLDNIFETHTVFDKMYVVLEDLVEKRKHASKAYDKVVDWKRYMKDKPENITFLSNFQLNKFRAIMRTWEDLEEIVGEYIKRAQSICCRRWYALDNIMIDLSFLPWSLLKKLVRLGW